MAEQVLHELNTNLERKVEERTAELSAREEKFRALVETTSDCIWETDAEGRFRYLSPSFLDLTGDPPEECLGRALDELILEGESYHTGAEQLAGLAKHHAS